MHEKPGDGRAVVFDLGETLADETRSWAAWADWLGVPHFTFFALVGVAANQPVYAEAPLRTALPSLDLVGLSAAWGVEKPAPAFFERIVRELGVPASRIVFVGDRLDIDVLPAQRAGMTGVLLRRGPWGFRDAASAGAAGADLRVDGLDELPDVLVRLVRGPP
jgi:FMN phosphatase YigB (HAD superfamily)